MINAIEIIATILLALFSIALVIVIMMQESGQEGLGAIGGGSMDAAVDRKQPKSKTEKLVFYTKILAVIVAVLAVGMVILQKFSTGS